MPLTLRPLSIALLLAGLLGPAAQAATFTVNDTGDDPLSVSVPCNGGITPCTLRAAIEAANNNPASADIINFNFSGGSVTIQPASALPLIVGATTIDGYDLGAGTPNTAPVGHNASISIRIDGQSAAASAGLQFLPGSGGSVLRGVAITRFARQGVVIAGVANVAVQGNFIGTDGIDTTGALANGGEAVRIDSGATNAIVGSTGSLGQRNLLVSDVNSSAVRLADSTSTGNRVIGNLIGTNAAGTQRVATARGVEVGHANDSVILGNVIGAGETGITIYGDNAGNGTRIIGNLIGVGTGGQSIGGGGDGIHIADGVGASALGPQGTRIGGTNAAAEGNAIAHWGGNGIRVQRLRNNTSLDRHTILGNSIHSNDTLGIELIAPSGAGNGPGNAPTGVNGAIPAPTITGIAPSGNSLLVEYRLDGAAPSTLYRFEAFASATCDASGWGEGQRYLGAGMLTTNAAGMVSSSGVWSAAVGEFVTLTATRDYGGAVGLGETSEFSQCVQVTAGNGPEPGPGGGAVAVPTLGHAALALLSALVAGVGALRRKRKF